jgi:hypothetical protein
MVERDEGGPVALAGVTCRRCGCPEVRLSRQGPHVRADCGRCGRFVKYVPHGEVVAALLQLPAGPPPERGLFDG